MAWTDVYKYVAPKFEPRRAGRTGFLAIGKKGPVIDAYANSVGKLLGISGLMNALISNPGLYGQSIADDVHQSVSAMPTSGVSTLFQFAVVTRGKKWIGGHEYDIYGPGDKSERIRLPPLAKTYEEFSVMCRKQGWWADAAVC